MTTTDSPTDDLRVLLGNVPGLGSAKIDTVVAAYPTLASLRAADVDGLTTLDGIGKTVARRILHTTGTVDDPTPVESFVHADKRANIPSDEQVHLAGATEEQTDRVLYPRDPDLDPQLVWRGKDGLDGESLAVPVVPIYIQERIDPRVLVENLRNTSPDQDSEPELTLFDDFDGIEDPISAIEFYEHGRQLVEPHDPRRLSRRHDKPRREGGPQGQGSDDLHRPALRHQVPVQLAALNRSRDVRDGRDVTPQPEQIRAFRDTWKDGIHSYLTYLRDRLVAARSLLNETGSVFVQISDENVHVVRNLLDEVFGPDNFVSLISFVTTSGFTQAAELPRKGDYILWYARSKPQLKYRTLWEEAHDRQGYRWLYFSDGRPSRGMTAQEAEGRVALPDDALVYNADNLQSQGAASEPQPFEFRGKVYQPGANSHWKASYPTGMTRLAIADRIHVARNSIRYRRFADDFPYKVRTNFWDDTGTGNFTDPKIFVVQTNSKVVERCILLSTDPGDLVLDPTCGSGTTAYVAERLGRRWITMDTSRVALALARRRLMGACFPWFLLVDSEEGAATEAREAGTQPVAPVGGWARDLRRGFVYRRALHIMLSTIANCEDIVPSISREELDAAIRRAADYEVLYEQPHEDRSIVRVSGPFTVESLSPHRTVEPASTQTRDDGDFVEMVLDNLAKAGVQNGYRDERLDLDWIEPSAGPWNHALGGFTDADGADLTVAISIGPEAGTVGREHIAQAAKEAVREARTDILLVCAYAFDAGAGEQANTETGTEHTFSVDGQRQVGRLQVLNVRINADLMMDDDLQNTGVGNLFTVFGQPDITVTEIDDDTITVTINGLDVYDPNKGTVRSSDASDIACWFIDTNYNDDAFFVRHAYFSGGGTDPFDSLKTNPPLRNQPRSLGSALPHRIPTLPPTGKQQDRRQSHQPLRRRSVARLHGSLRFDPSTCNATDKEATPRLSYSTQAMDKEREVEAGRPEESKAQSHGAEQDRLFARLLNSYPSSTHRGSVA